MNFARLTERLLLIIISAFLLLSPGLAAERDEDRIRPAASLPETTPWNLRELSVPPPFQWLGGRDGIRALQYRGEPYQGERAAVFAYYATPGTLAGDPSNDQNLPAVVLVHGGGGQAFREWVELWAKRGYAAISMDLAGCGEDGKRLPNGGPDQSDEAKFGQIDGPVTDQWTYHAVANVILAHSLIRSFKEVNADRTAVTGISWGGYLTCIVAGLDSRFKAAVPVYGCGFLNENSVWLPRFASMTPDQRTKWVTLFDPASYVGSAAMPVFFMNGTNDFAYPLDSYAKTYRLVKGPRNLRITIRMPHSHKDGWAPKEIGLFIDQYLKDGVPLPTIEPPVVHESHVSARVSAKTRLISASLIYTVGTETVNKREWREKPAVIEGGRIRAEAPPAETTIWCVTALDERDAVVSSPLVFPEK
jgi:dienelactone hydrolase